MTMGGSGPDVSNAPMHLILFTSWLIHYLKPTASIVGTAFLTCVTGMINKFCIEQHWPSAKYLYSREQLRRWLNDLSLSNEYNLGYEPYLMCRNITYVLRSYKCNFHLNKNVKYSAWKSTSTFEELQESHITVKVKFYIPVSFNCVSTHERRTKKIRYGSFLENFQKITITFSKTGWPCREGRCIRWFFTYSLTSGGKTRRNSLPNQKIVQGQSGMRTLTIYECPIRLWIWS